MAEALYRKYRPQVFEDVVGQEPIERTLKNAIEQDKVSHAYLFCGPRGTGKTTTARLLAKALLCQHGPTPDPDGTCEDCVLIAEGTHPDVYELDAASRTGVENVREEIISRIQFAPTRGRSKIYIIDEVHMLSTAAFNALLKTLEEPPSHVVFILCTTDPQKVPETIHSRCQRFDFRRIAPESMVSRLGAICIAEGVEFEGEALDLIAHRAEGGLRNALTSLEQIIAFENGKVTLAGAERLLGAIDSNDMAEIMSLIGRRDIANCFVWTANYVETGADLAQFVRDMAEQVRNLYVMSVVGDDVELDVSETMRRELASELQWFGPDRLSRLLGVLGDLSAELKTSSNPRLSFEIALTRMVRPDSELTLESLAERVEALESGYSSVAHVLPGQPIVSQDSVASPAPARETRVQSAPAAANPAPDRVILQSGASSEIMGGMAVGSPASRSRQGEGPAVASGDALSGTVRQGADAQPENVRGEAVSQEPATGEAYGTRAVAGSASPLSALANPAALQRIWQAALASVKKQKQAYGVLFMGTKAVFDESVEMLKIIFSADSAFAFNAVQKPDVQDALAAALEKAVGATVPFCYEKNGATTSVQGDAAPIRAAAGRGSFAPQASNAPENAVPESNSGGMGRAGNADAGSAGVDRAARAVEAAASPSDAVAKRPEAPNGGMPSGAGGQPQGVPYDDVPYEQVPYDEMPYDAVPYDDMDAGFPPAHDMPPVADASTTASSVDSHLTPEGGLADNVGDIQAMLQAGFGGGVVFSEVEDE